MTPERFDEIYTWKPDGYGGVTVQLRQPIQTLDTRTVDPVGVPMPEGAHVRRHTSARAPLTRDELLESVGGKKRIALGKQWNAESGLTPVHDKFVDAVGELGEGTFSPGRVLHAEDIGKLGRVIDLAKTWTGQLEDLHRGMSDAHAAGQLEGTTPEDLVAKTFGPAKDRGPAGDLPVEPGGGLDGRPTKDARGSTLLAAAARHTADYAAGLAPKRALLTAQIPEAPQGAARVTAKEFAALRVNKGRSGG